VLPVNERFLASDRIVEKDGQLVIVAPPMDAWVVRKHRKTAIIVAGERWFVVERAPLGPRLMRYVLARWPHTDTGLPGDEIVYDEAYVVQRDEVMQERATRERGRLARWALQPLIGFAWEGTKRTAHERYGFHPRSVTKQSLYVQWVVMLLLSSVLMFIPFVVYAPIAVLVIDGFFRYSDVFRDTQYPYGFLEWVFRWRRTRF
jgi:hypothetical protein